MSNVKVSTLANGLRVAVDEMPEVESASLGIWVQCGTRHESAELNGMAHMLVRGYGEVFGWFVIERMARAHTNLSTEGVGRQLAFEMYLVRVPTPAAPNYFSSLWSSIGAAPL